MDTKAHGESVLPGFRDKTRARQTLIIGHKWAQSDVRDKLYRTESYIGTSDIGLKRTESDIFVGYLITFFSDIRHLRNSVQKPGQAQQNSQNRTAKTRTARP
jgi:hypothetical protein